MSLSIPSSFERCWSISSSRSCASCFCDSSSFKLLLSLSKPSCMSWGSNTYGEVLRGKVKTVIHYVNSKVSWPKNTMMLEKIGRILHAWSVLPERHCFVVWWIPHFPWSHAPKWISPYRENNAREEERETMVTDWLKLLPIKAPVEFKKTNLCLITTGNILSYIFCLLVKRDCWGFPQNNAMSGKNISKL